MTQLKSEQTDQLITPTEERFHNAMRIPHQKYVDMTDGLKSVTPQKRMQKIVSKNKHIQQM